MFFVGLDAEVYLTPVMNADDLRAGLEKTMKGKWNPGSGGFDIRNLCESVGW